jgi:hypothetical protein
VPGAPLLGAADVPRPSPYGALGREAVDAGAVASGAKIKPSEPGERCALSTPPLRPPPATTVRKAIRQPVQAR